MGTGRVRSGDIYSSEEHLRWLWHASSECSGCHGAGSVGGLVKRTGRDEATRVRSIRAGLCSLHASSED